MFTWSLPAPSNPQPVPELRERCSCGAKMSVPKNYYNYRDDKSAEQIIVEWRNTHICTVRAT